MLKATFAWEDAYFQVQCRHAAEMDRCLDELDRHISEIVMFEKRCFLYGNCVTPVLEGTYHLDYWRSIVLNCTY